MLVRDGEIYAAEVLELAVSRANAVNPAINCIVEKLYDRARHEANAGLPKGPFTGSQRPRDGAEGHSDHTGPSLL